jgi:atypical dual specificity phosphatase
MEYDIYIGNIQDASDHEGIREAGISTVVKLTNREPTRGYPKEVDVVRHPMMDGPRNEGKIFRRAVESVTELLRDGESVLVHCAAGKSRSVTVTAAALSIVEKNSFEESLDAVRRCRDTNAHPALIKRGKEVAGVIDERHRM